MLYDFTNKTIIIPAAIYVGPKGPMLNSELLQLDHYYVQQAYGGFKPLIHVKVGNSFVLTLRARYVGDVICVLAQICYTCNFTKVFCRCPQYCPMGSDWVLRGNNGDLLHGDLIFFTKRNRFVRAIGELTLQGSVMTRAPRQYGYGQHVMTVIVDNFLTLTLRVDNPTDVYNILNSLCAHCYLQNQNCKCNVFLDRYGYWNIDTLSPSMPNHLMATYVELQFDEMTLPEVPTNPRNAWGALNAWYPGSEGLSLFDTYYELANEIGTYPLSIIGEFVGWSTNFSETTIELILNEESRRRRCLRRPEMSVELQGTVVANVETILSDDSPYSIGVKLFEDVGTMVYYCKRSKSLEDLGVAITSFIRSVTGQPVSMIITRLLTLATAEFAEYFRLQSGDTWTDKFSELFNHYSDVKNSSFATKVLKVLNTVVFSVVLKKLGVEPDGDLIKKIECKKIRPSMLNCLTFLDALGDLTQFCLKQGRQYYLTGDPNCFFMDADSLADWYLRARRLEENYKFLNNPDAVGLKVHTFLNELHEAIIDGQSIIKYMKHATLEFKMVMSHLTRLEGLSKEYLTLCAAQSLRRQPFGVVLYGKPGVGKSHILEAIYHFHAKLRGLDPSPGYKFQFNSDEEYMTNFKSYMHCIVIDDVAQHKVSAVQGIDPSLGMCIKLINNQPTCPPQAALDDKGKTPVLSELVIATTNTRHMNIPFYFTKSYAVMRRFKIHIELELKKQYRNETGGIRGDIDDKYEDKWDFIVSHPQLTNQGDETMHGEFVKAKTCYSLKELFEYIGPIMEEHHRNQDQFLKSAATFRDVELCDKCKLPQPICEKSRTCRRFYEDDDLQGDEADEKVDFEYEEPYIGEEELSAPEGVRSPHRIFPLMEVGRPRFVSPAMANTFIDFVRRDDRDNTTLEIIAQEFAYIHYPIMMKLGYPNQAILEDFEKFKGFRLQELDILHLRASLDFLPTNDSFFVKHLRRIILWLYMETAIFRWLVSTMLRYSLTATIVIHIFNFLKIGTRARTRMMRDVGREIDESLLGTHPLSRVWILFSVASVVGMYYGYYNRAQNVPEEDRIFTDVEEAEEKWKTATTKHQEKAEMYATARALVCAPTTTQEERLTKVDNVMEELRQRTEECNKTLEEYRNAILTMNVPQAHSGEADSDETQGKLHEIGKFPDIAPNDNVKNVWLQEERGITPLLFHDSRATTMEALQKSLNLSCVRVSIIWQDGKTIKNYKACGIILSNDCILINHHGVPEGGFECTILWSSVKGRIYTQVQLVVQPSQVFRIPNRDIAIIHTKALPPLVSNITKNFSKSNFDGRFDGYYMIRNEDGTFRKHPVYGIRRVAYCETIGPYDYHCIAFRGRVTTPTVSGDCGSVLIAETGYGPIVLGFHFLYRSCDRVTFASSLFSDDFAYLTTGVQGTTIEISPYKEVPNKTSFIQYHEEGSIMYHGEIDYRVRYKTRVGPTEIKNQLVQSLGFGTFRFEDKYSKPLMHSYIPQQRSLSEYLIPSHNIDEVRLQKCAKAIVKNILDNLPVEELKLITPYPYLVALNGVPSMAYVDKVKRKTSMGFPWHCVKEKFLEPIEDMSIWPEGVIFTKEIEDAIEIDLNKYLRGERCHPVFTSNLKDEVVSKKKFEIGKTRTFFSCPAPYLVIMRMFFLGLSRVVQRNWKTFHVVIGVNCHSHQWQQVHDYLVGHGTDQIVAGDFAGFDKKFHMSFSRWAFYVIKEICVASGNYEGMELALDALGADFVNPTVNYFGMLVTLLSGEVSGHQLTTIFNCICSNMYIMYAYGEYYEIEEFFDFVSPLFLGDDNIFGVSVERPLFHHTNIQSVLDNIGVGYTMAEKEAVSKPYISIYESTFLKRGFRYSNELGAIVGPLDKESIVKMLTYQVKSKTCAPSEQLAQAMVSASVEAFYHGRGFFEYISKTLDTVTKSDALKEAIAEFPRFTWEENVIRFLSTGDLALDTGHNQKCSSIDSYCKDCSHVSLQSLRVGHSPKSARAFLEVPIQGLVRLTPESETKLSSIGQMGRDKNIPTAENMKESLISGSNTSNDIEEIVTFANEARGDEVELDTPMNPLVGSMTIKSDLASFLSRPTRIFTYAWDIGGGDGYLLNIRPWKLYVDATRIKQKIQTFPLLRGNLCVKFVINASPFYYGALGAFYQPLWNQTVQSRNGSDNSYTPGYQVCTSQRKCVWLNPQEVTNAQFTLPFFHFKDFLSTTLADFEDMGQIDLVQFSPLLSANGVPAGSGVSVNAYAWLTDIDLAGATARDVLQGEYKSNGQISGMASTIGNMASKMKNVPMVGQFASATETVANAVGSVASFFGFSNVPVIEDVKPMKSLAFHTLSSSEISEPIQKLSLQPKAETTVGMYPGDVDEDMLLISNFVARESFVCGSTWETINPEESVLFTSYITPMMYEYGGTNPAWYPTPMCYAAALFQYWRGDIIFRFKVIRSKYHRGRLQITWDRNGDFTHMPAIGDPSVFSVIMDLDESDEVEVRVPYTNEYPFIPLDELTTNTIKFWSNGPSPTDILSNVNGCIQVRVLNPLTAPLESSEATVLCFVRGAENLQFAGPRNIRSNTSLTTLQGDIITLNGPSTDDAKVSMTVFGERIYSFRELMHRQSRVASQVINKSLDAAGHLQTWNCPFTRLPRTYGYNNNAITEWEATSTDKGFNYVTDHVATRLAFCFIGYRGSTNYTFNTCRFDGTNVPNSSLSVCRITDNSSATYPTAYTTSGVSNSYSQFMKNINTNSTFKESGGGGMALTNQLTQAGLSVNLPYYTNQKFIPYDLRNFTTADGQPKKARDYFNFQLKKYVNTAADNAIVVEIYFGTGPDFDLVYFLNCPPIFSLSSPVAKT